MATAQNGRLIGSGLAILAVFIWSGNFIIAKTASQQIGPVSLAFYRWITATVLIAPLAWRQFRQETAVVRKHLRYFLWTAFTGITLFNTCVYVAGHYTSAINLALIGTTTSPVFSTIMAVLFLKERMNLQRVIGLFICISGVLYLISHGSIAALAAFHFSTGDLWILAGAMAFAIYSILVRKKPGGISAMPLLFTVFGLGTLMLLPIYVWEISTSAPVQWNLPLAGSILYLGVGASVISFLCWNLAIQRLGAARTVLFGNLIPVFSVLEAVLLLGEALTATHLVSGALVVGGLVVANYERKKTKLADATP